MTFDQLFMVHPVCWFYILQAKPLPMEMCVLGVLVRAAPRLRLFVFGFIFVHTLFPAAYRVVRRGKAGMKWNKLFPCASYLLAPVASLCVGRDELKVSSSRRDHENGYKNPTKTLTVQGSPWQRLGQLCGRSLEKELCSLCLHIAGGIGAARGNRTR